MVDEAKKEEKKEEKPSVAAQAAAPATPSVDKDRLLRDTYNQMRVRIGVDGRLREPENMTPIQREAFSRMAALHGPKT